MMSDKDRYVIFRVYAKHYWKNRKEITGGIILDYFDTIEDIARSEYYAGSNEIKEYHRNSVLYNDSKSTLKETSERMVKYFVEFLEGELPDNGLIYNTGLEGLEKEEIKKLVKRNSYDGDEPVSYFLLDTQTKHKSDSIDEVKSWLREIKLKELENKKINY